jgi:hypothetical protein
MERRRVALLEEVRGGGGCFPFFTPLVYPRAPFSFFPSSGVIAVRGMHYVA